MGEASGGWYERRTPQSERKLRLGDGRWAMGDGRWVMGDERMDRVEMKWRCWAQLGSPALVLCHPPPSYLSPTPFLSRSLLSLSSLPSLSVLGFTLLQVERPFAA